MLKVPCSVRLIQVLDKVSELRETQVCKPSTAARLWKAATRTEAKVKRIAGRAKLLRQRRAGGKVETERSGRRTINFEQQAPLLSTEIGRIPQPTQPGLLLLRLVDND